MSLIFLYGIFCPNIKFDIPDIKCDIHILNNIPLYELYRIFYSLISWRTYESFLLHGYYE